MDTIKPRLIINTVFLAILSCFIFSCKKDSSGQQPAAFKSSQKDMLTFEFYKADNSNLPTDYNTSFTGTNITATLPSNINFNGLKAAFTASEKANITVNGQLQTSQVTANDFRQPVVYTVKAEDGSTKNYTVSVSLLN